MFQHLLDFLSINKLLHRVRRVNATRGLKRCSVDGGRGWTENPDGLRRETG